VVFLAAALESRDGGLAGLAGANRWFLRQQLPDMVASIQFVVTHPEALHHMRSCRCMLAKLFGVVMNMMLDAQDEHAWYAAVLEEKDARKTGNYYVRSMFLHRCVETLDRLAVVVGGNTIFPEAA
jgi:hypothetical protein